MLVRPASEADVEAWSAMRLRLWPDAGPDELDREPRPMALVAVEDGRPIGFAEASVRSIAEGGPDSPAAYLEGIWVEPDRRRRGVARALLAGVEAWARGRGLAWLGSDALLDNDDSHAWHRRVGFDEVERLVVFGKRLA